MALNLDKIKERLLQASGQGKKSDMNSIFWKIPEGESVIRIISPKDGDPFREYHQHYSVGKSLPFLCPRKQYGESCPTCEYVNKLYKSTNPEDIALAKKISVKARYFSPVLVRGEEAKGIRFWSYSKTTYVKLLKLVNKVEEYGDITDPNSGTDLVISYETPQGAAFPLTSIEPRRKESPLCKDMSLEDCEKMVDTIPNLEKGLNKKSSEDIKKIMDEWLLGEDSEEHGEEISGDKEVEKYGKKEVKKEESMSEIDKAFSDLMSE